MTKMLGLKILEAAAAIVGIPAAVAYVSKHLNYGAFKWIKPKKISEDQPNPVLIEKEGLSAHVAVDSEKYQSLEEFRETNKEKPLMLFFGGSCDIAYNAVGKYGVLWENVVFCSPDYYGTQSSRGTMNLNSMKQTALDFYDKLIHPNSWRKVIVVGYSYGCGMATYLASQRRVDSLILVSAYRDSADLYNIYTPIFFGVMKNLIGDNIKCVEYAKGVTCPAYIIGSDRDLQLSARIQKKIVKHFKDGHIKIFEGLKHTEYFQSPDVISYIQCIIDECAKKEFQ